MKRLFREKPQWVNPDGSYLSEDEIVTHMVQRIKGSRAQTMWEEAKLEDVCVLHYKLGREMRDAYGLWDRQNPHAVQSPRPTGGDGLRHPLFPTSISARVFERVWGEFHR